MAHGLGYGPVGAAVAAWPVALVGSYELLTMVIRSSHAAPDNATDSVGILDPLQEQAAEIFADHWQRLAFLWSVRSVLGCTSASIGRGGCEITWLRGLRGGRTVSLREQLVGRASS